MTFDTHVAALAASIVITVASHVMLKFGAGKSRRKLNCYSFMGLSGFGLVTILIVYALQSIELKTLMACSALTYLITPMAAKYILREAVSRRQLTGAAIILVGVIVFFAGG